VSHINRILIYDLGLWPVTASKKARDFSAFVGILKCLLPPITPVVGCTFQDHHSPEMSLSIFPIFFVINKSFFITLSISNQNYSDSIS
jgi:hypothetical protein